MKLRKNCINELRKEIIDTLNRYSDRSQDQKARQVDVEVLFALLGTVSDIVSQIECSRCRHEIIKALKDEMLPGMFHDIAVMSARADNAPGSQGSRHIH